MDSIKRRDVLKFATLGFSGLSNSKNFKYNNSYDNRDINKLWSTDIGGTHGESAPAIVDDKIYIGGGSHTGWGALHAINTKTGDKVWTYEADHGEKEGIESSPIVIQGSVYIGSPDGKIYSINKETGEEEWHFNTGDEISNSPAYDGTYLYVFTDEQNLYKINSNTGELIRQKNIENDPDDIRRYNRSPFVVEDTLYLSVDTSTCGTSSSGFRCPVQVEGAIYSIDTENLNTNWINNQLRAAPEITYHNGIIVADAFSIYGIASESGRTVWEYDGGGATSVNPTAIGESVYAVTHGPSYDIIVSLNILSGDVEWKSELDRLTRVGATVTEDSVLVGLRDVNYNGISRIDSFDINTGEKKWEMDINSGSIVTSPLIISDGILYFNTYNKLNAIDINNNKSSIGSWVSRATGGHHSRWMITKGDKSAAITINHNPESSTRVTDIDEDIQSYANQLDVFFNADTSLRFGGDTDRYLRVVEPTSGDSVTYTPTDDARTVPLDKINRLELRNDGTGEPLGCINVFPDNNSELSSKNIEATVEGETGIFTDEIFSEYVVELVEKNGGVLASTDKRLVGMGYEAQVKNLDNVVTITREPTVNENWTVRFEIDSADFDLPRNKRILDAIEIKHTDNDAVFEVPLYELDVEPGEYKWNLLLVDEQRADLDRERIIRIGGDPESNTGITIPDGEIPEENYEDVPVDPEVAEAVDQDGDGNISLEDLVQANLKRIGDPNDKVNGVQVTLKELVELNIWRLSG